MLRQAFVYLELDRALLQPRGYVLQDDLTLVADAPMPDSGDLLELPEVRSHIVDLQHSRM